MYKYLVSFLYLPFSCIYAAYTLFVYPKSFIANKWSISAIMGFVYYCIEPLENLDLYRYFQQIELSSVFYLDRSYNWVDDGLYLKNFIFWVIGRIGSPHWISFLAAFVITYVILYLIEKTNCKLNLSPFNIVGLIIFEAFVLPWSGLGNIRNVIAFSLGILAMFRELVEKKYDIITLFLYIAPCFVHVTGILVVISRITIAVIGNRLKLLVFLSLFIPSSIIAVYQHFFAGLFSNVFGAIFSKFILKAGNAMMSTSVYAEAMKNSGYVLADQVIKGLLLLSIITLIIDYNKNVKGKLIYYNLFVFIFCDISFILIISRAVKYWVFSFAVTIAFLPLLAYYIKKYKYSAIKIKICLLYIPVCIVLGLVENIYKLPTSFDILQSIDNLSSTSVYYLLLNSLFHLI